MSPMATRRGKDETKSETNMATMKKSVLKHLLAFSTINQPLPIAFPQNNKIRENQIFVSFLDLCWNWNPREKRPIRPTTIHQLRRRISRRRWWRVGHTPAARMKEKNEKNDPFNAMRKRERRIRKKKGTPLLRF